MPRDILTHELNRVRTMTNDQLDVRYGKMTKDDKIQNFYTALKQENKNPALQNKIANDCGYDQAPTYTPAVVKAPEDHWILTAPGDNSHEVVFTPEVGNGLHGIEIVEYKNGNRSNSVTYKISDARVRWDLFISEGYLRRGGRVFNK